jgi:hypothetical protein
MAPIPVNFDYVKVKKLTLTDDDGVDREYSVLVLDDDKNRFYWEEYMKLYNAISKHAPTDLKCWEITANYLNDAIAGMIQEAEDFQIYLFGLPIRLVEETEVPYCVLVFNDNTTQAV